jgi:dihydroxy-acid dehydratase
VRIVDLVRQGIYPSTIMTRAAFENAVRVNAAIGGSTNALIHLLAIAGRLAVELSLEDLDRLASPIPLLANLLPSGKYLMEDFCYAGGLPALMSELGDLLHLDSPTVSGATVGEAITDAEVWNRDVIATVLEPILPPDRGTAVLRGSLCPDGAVIKRSAASPNLMEHRGRALVFDSASEYHQVAADPDLPVDESTVIVVRNSGPVGYPGMPENGNVPVPAKLLARGVDDILRISDGRMSGTAFGTVVVHTAPEAAVGGPIALVRNGDWIEISVSQRRLTLDVDQTELTRRRAAWRCPLQARQGGYESLFVDHVLQADRGVDFDFLVGSRGHRVPRESH